MQPYRRPVAWVVNACLGLLVLAASLPAAPCPAADAAVVLSASEAVQTGVSLERQRKWRDAIDHYKQALESWPEDELLVYGLRRAQFQFSIDRRYTDRSFQESLLRMPQGDSLELFDEVIDHVTGRFVDSIDLTSLVAHGTESLWLALSNEKFLDRNLFGADPGRLKKFRQELRDRYWNKPVSSKASAHGMIGEVCDLGFRLVGLEPGAVVMEYVFGACNCLDDYSNVLTPGRLNDLFSNIDGEFVGIGIVMEAELGQGMKLIQVLPESPAQEQGLRSGDFLTGVEGADCRYMTTDEAAGLLTGRAGTAVRLEVRKAAGGVEEVSVPRREVHVRSIPLATIVDRDAGIAYIQMSGFQKTSAEELDQALAALHRDGMRSLIWDVRGNPGGLLTAAVEVLDRFIDRGVLVETRGRTFDQNYTYTAQTPGDWDIPLVLLIDGSSASASEIVAGAIRDHHRGTLVGRKTFGKWSVQSIYNLASGGGVRLTTAKFYSPNGDNHSKVGVKPDVAVAADDDDARPLGEVDVEHDADLQAALQVLKTRGAVTSR